LRADVAPAVDEAGRWISEGPGSCAEIVALKEIAEDGPTRQIRKAEKHSVDEADWISEPIANELIVHEGPGCRQIQALALAHIVEEAS
jgi:hypothetical protein